MFVGYCRLYFQGTSLGCLLDTVNRISRALVWAVYWAPWSLRGSRSAATRSTLSTGIYQSQLLTVRRRQPQTVTSSCPTSRRPVTMDTALTQQYHHCQSEKIGTGPSFFTDHVVRGKGKKKGYPDKLTLFLPLARSGPGRQGVQGVGGYPSLS